MKLNEDYFEDEVRDKYYIPSLMKRCHAAELEVLDVLGTLLDQQGVCWCATGETLLGAARCNGFLPWSDTVEIAVPEQERQRFLEVIKKLPDDLRFTENKVCNGSDLNREREFLTKYHGFPFGCGVQVHFDDAVRVCRGENYLFFENFHMPVPEQYEKVLEKHFGPGWEIYSPESLRPWYPFFMAQEHRYEAENNQTSPYFYEFRMGDLIRNRDNDGNSLIDNFLSTFVEGHNQVLKAVQMSENGSIIPVFTHAQDVAVKFGNFIEVNFPEAAIVVVPMLEAYCNRLYLLGEVLTASPADLNTTRAQYGEESVSPEVYLESCMKFASAVQAAVKNEITGKKEVVFLPFKASGWKNMKPLYQYYKARQDCRVYVVPVPYYHVTDQNTAGEKCYEGGDIPDEADAIPYEAFNLYTHMPDTVVTQNPYDQYSLGLRLPADLYSDELRKFTKHLIYVPWFDEVDLDKMPARAMSDYYIRQPGVVKADVVLVRSPKERKYYIDSLTEFAGEDTRPIWEEKIQTMQGSVVL